MTQYKKTKKELEAILGVKAENIIEKAGHMGLAACCIANEKYTVYIFKTSEIEYEGEYTIPDKVSYYAVETKSRLPVSWSHSCRGQRHDLKRIGHNYNIDATVIDEDNPQTHNDRMIMWALYNCAHMGHFTEESLFD